MLGDICVGVHTVQSYKKYGCLLQVYVKKKIRKDNKCFSLRIFLLFP